MQILKQGQIFISLLKVKKTNTMKSTIQLLIVVVLLGAGYFAYQKYVKNQKIHLIKNIEHEVTSADEYVFSRDNMKFTELKEYKVHLAHINYLYTWEASVPFGFKTKDMDINFDDNTNTLILKIKQLRLFPLTISNPEAKKTSELLWLNQGEPAANFFKKLPEYTKTLVDKELRAKKGQVSSIKEITINSLKVRVGEILQKLDINDIQLEVSVDGLVLYDGKSL